MVFQAQFDVKKRHQTHQAFGHDQQLGQPFVALFLRGKTKHYYKGEPGDRKYVKHDWRKRIAQAGATVVVAGGDDRHDAVNDIQQPHYDQLYKGGGAGLIGEFHA